MRPMAFLSLLTLSTLSLTAQTEPGVSTKHLAQETLKASSEEVLLDVIVRDKHGRPINDLKREEIEIFDEGVAQKIADFRLIAGGELVGAEMPDMTAGKRMVPKGTVDPRRQIHLETLVFERLGVDGRRFARQAALQLLSSELKQNVYLAVFSIDQRLALLQSFTNDRKLLTQAIDLATSGTYSQFAALSDKVQQQLEASARTEPAGFQSLATSGPAAQSAASTASIDAFTSRIALRILQNSERASRLQQGQASMYSLLSLVNGQRSLPGRKTLIYFSEGLQVPSNLEEVFQSVISASNLSNVSVYGVDARGLVTTSQMDSTRHMLNESARLNRTSLTQNQISSDEMKGMDIAQDAIRANAQSALGTLAESTGGFLVADTNDLRTPMRRINEDAQTYYELGYVPQTLAYDGRFHKLQVRVSRPGLKVQTRSGYYALPTTEGEPLLPYEMPMLAALSASPIPHTFDYHAAAFHFGPRPQGVEYSVVVEIPLKEISFTESQEKSTYQAHVSVMALIKNAQGAVVEKFSQDQPFGGPVVQLPAVRQASYFMKRHLVLAPGRYTLETAVLDRASAKVSARRAALIVMLPAPGVAISSLSLIRSVRPESPDNSDPDDPLHFKGVTIVPSLGNTIPRGTGSGVSFYFVIYPSAGSQAKTELSLQYFKDRQSVGHATPELPAPDGQGRICYVATSPADNFPPGEYEMHAVVRQGTTAAEGNALFTILP